MAGTVPGSSKAMLQNRAEMSTTSSELIAARLSHERLSGYLAVCESDLGRAISLYEWNVAMSGAFYELLCDVEISLRNALHEQLTDFNDRRGHGGHWYENHHGVLEEEAENDIERARVRRKRKPESPGQIVSELTFGFWRFLLTKRYRSTLWPWALQHAFPNVDNKGRSQIPDRVARLNDLRNRVAHHEPIHTRKLEADLSDCEHVLDAICPTTKDWALQRARVEAVLLSRP